MYFGRGLPISVTLQGSGSGTNAPTFALKLGLFQHIVVCSPPFEPSDPGESHHGRSKFCHLPREPSTMNIKPPESCLGDYSTIVAGDDVRRRCNRPSRANDDVSAASYELKNHGSSVGFSS
jgi:hypothetical protein